MNEPRLAFHLPGDLEPPHGLDMTAGSTIARVEKLATDMFRNGFDRTKPCLVGYRTSGGEIQLLSGTHRHRAASLLPARIFLPVRIWKHEDVERARGDLSAWAAIMKDVPLTDALDEMAKIRLEDLNTLSHHCARIEGMIDPAVMAVFSVESDDEIGRVLVVRNDIQNIELMGEWRGVQLLDVPESLLSDARSGRLQLPAGFSDATRWREASRGVRRPEVEIRGLVMGGGRGGVMDMTFSTGVNIIIGKNGVGKTTVLDTIAHALHHVVSALGQSIEVQLVRDGSQTDARHARVVMSAYRDQLIDWRNGQQVNHSRASPFNVLDVVRWSADTGHMVPLPVIAYYDARRASGSKMPPSRWRLRAAGYHNWHGGNPADLQRWFADMSLLEVQRGASVGILKAVREALSTCLAAEGLDEFRYDVEQRALAARKDGAWTPFAQLGAGARNILGLVADLAMRCCQLNSHLGERAALETSGIVLIDDLGLHLHPSWQNHVMDDLQKAFPCIQFIVTTHAPLVVSSRRPDEIWLLTRDGSGEMSAMRPARDPRLLVGGELLRKIFGVANSPPGNQ